MTALLGYLGRQVCETLLYPIGVLKRLNQSCDSTVSVANYRFAEYRIGFSGVLGKGKFRQLFKWLRGRVTQCFCILLELRDCHLGFGAGFRKSQDMIKKFILWTLKAIQTVFEYSITAAVIRLYFPYCVCGVMSLLVEGILGLRYRLELRGKCVLKRDNLSLASEIFCSAALFSFERLNMPLSLSDS